MKSQVFFASLRGTLQRNLFNKLDALLDKTDFPGRVKTGNLVAIKLHFGERGNTAFIRPIFIRRIVERMKQCKAKPFLTDANTLYRGERTEGVSHLTVAIEHGFNYAVVNAPVIIADGLRGNTFEKVTINQKIFKTVYIGAEIVHADALISCAHFKGHELTGFGGTLKNLGMGCASRQGKLNQHSSLTPKVDSKQCTACQACIQQCPAEAISLSNRKARIEQKKCFGCADCIRVCPQGAVQIRWNESADVFQKKMIEYAYGVLKGKGKKALFLNFLIQISPACDCYGMADAPIVPDIGILASIDPVAIDQASCDLVNNERGLEGTALKANLQKGKDKFLGIYPKVDWTIQLDYAEKIGLGSRMYDLIAV
jgi:hypothetical protein